MVIVTALLTAKPGKEAELEALATAMVEHVKDEPGALEYTLHRGVDNPHIFVFHERYADQTACEAHMGTPYLARFLGQAAELLACEPQVHFLREVTRIPVKDADKRV
ncbi:hypothetical protein JCM15519_30060 [Fundidesulfovibrio butyratiphilus]